MIDASVANRQFHSDMPILQACENVELAFKGRRDMLLFTTKRVIFVDTQGFLGMGKKMEFTSLPYSTISAFSVRSAGSWIDKDSELCFWLDFDDVFNPPRAKEDDPPPPPIPRKSYLEIDFQKSKVDMLVLHRYLSERVMVVNRHDMKPYTSPVLQSLLVPSPPGTVESVLDWIGGNAVAIDSGAVNEKFCEAGLIQHDERVAFAFKTGRDSLYLTNKRIFLIDVQVNHSNQLTFDLWHGETTLLSRFFNLISCFHYLFHIGVYWKEKGVHVCFVEQRSILVSGECWQL
jgi:hypothetical protein